MKQTHLLLSLTLLGFLSLSPFASAAETPSAQQVCAALTKSAKKAGKKPDAKAKARLALAASIKRLEKEPENVNVRSKGKGLTPIMIAAALGEKDAIRWLISIGADPTVKDAAGKDAFARTQDEEVTSLLKGGGISSWKEAIAYLESIRAQDWPKPPDVDNDWILRQYKEGGKMSRSVMLATCRSLAEASSNRAELSDFLAHCSMLGLLKLLPFLFQEGTEKGCFAHEPATFYFEDWQYVVPSKLWLPIFKVYAAHGGVIYFGHPSYNEEICTNKELAEWMSSHMGWKEGILYGASACSTHMIKRGMELAKEKAVPKNDLQDAMDEALERCAQHDGREAEKGAPVNPNRMKAAKLLIQAGASPQNERKYTNCMEYAKSDAMKKLLEAAAKQKGK